MNVTITKKCEHCKNDNTIKLDEDELNMFSKEELDVYKFPKENKFTRFEVITEDGRVLTKHNINNIDLLIQDGGKTLKVILK